jgi:predicted DNA-binding transcriptional regulator AlpA
MIDFFYVFLFAACLVTANLLLLIGQMGCNIPIWLTFVNQVPSFLAVHPQPNFGRMVAQHNIWDCLATLYIKLAVRTPARNAVASHLYATLVTIAARVAVKHIAGLNNTADYINNISQPRGDGQMPSLWPALLRLHLLGSSNMNEMKRWATREDAAAILGVSLSTVDRCLAKKTFPFDNSNVRRIGRRVLISMAALVGVPALVAEEAVAGGNR